MLVSARHIMSMLCEDWRFRSTGALSVIAEEPRPLMLLYQIRKVCGFFVERSSPKLVCLGVWEKGLGCWRLRFCTGVGGRWVDAKTGYVGGFRGSEVSMVGKGGMGGVVSP